MKSYWFLAFSIQTGELFNYNTEAKNIILAIAQFKKNNPNGKIIDFGRRL